MSDKHLEAMLKKARNKNEKSAITGMLLYRDGFFIQALEGETGDNRKPVCHYCKR
jgi:hypothetical protein